MKGYIFIVLAILLQGYSCTKTAKAPAGSGDGIVREYHSNGKLKTEISAQGDLRQGPTRNFDFQGRLLSEVNYVNNIREGIATNYYAKSGKINSTLVFKHGIKEGDEIWYYESGSKYRVSPYINGQIEGTQKLYFENGQLKAEIPYKNGSPGKGLREYKKDGTLISDYPSVTIRKEDHLKDANKIVLIISLSDNSENVKFYRGSLREGKYLHKGLLLLATQNGITQMDFNLAPGAKLDQNIIISANFRTPMGNPFVISKTYNLQAFNP